MSASTLVSSRFKQFERISTEQKDTSFFNRIENSQRTKEEIESSFIATSIPENKAQKIENILYSKEPLIKERNAILSNPFKYYNPFYRNKLKTIDARLDELDLQLYIIESETKQIESDLDRAIESAEKRLRNIEKPCQK